MSCRPPEPLPDLVTKDHCGASLDAELNGLAEQHARDRRADQVRHYWLVGIYLSTAVSVWLKVAGVIA